MYNLEKEKREAIYAGQKALRSLQEAKKRLDGANTWSWIDMLGGGGLTGLIKYSQLDDARHLVDQARYDLEVFQREVKDVMYLDPSLRVDVDNFLLFLDFFCDGFIADYLTHRRIKEARRKIEQAIENVENVLRRL